MFEMVWVLRTDWNWSQMEIETPEDLDLDGCFVWLRCFGRTGTRVKRDRHPWIWNGDGRS